MERSNPAIALQSLRSTDLNRDKDGKRQGTRKRFPDGSVEPTNAKRIKPNSGSSSKVPMSKLTLKLGPKPAELEVFPCCLCVSLVPNGLLRVHDPPIGQKDFDDGTHGPTIWRAHEECAKIVPETWVDEIEVSSDAENGSKAKEKVVFGVDGIVKDRWNLVCDVRTHSAS